MNTTQTHELGNNDIVSTGYYKVGDVFVAMTRVDSKDFKTERGAIAWLAKRGYKADGTRA